MHEEKDSHRSQPSIFKFMPQDARDYDKALLWRGVSQTVGFTADAKPQWTGNLSEFLGQTAGSVKIEVYVRSDKPKNSKL